MRKTRDTSKKRQAILDGAVAVFTEMGYKEASMDKIAETAGVSKNTIYNHFQSKENLFQEMISDFLTAQQAVKDIPYQPNVPLADQLSAFAKAEMYLIDDPKRRDLSRLLTSVFIMDISFSIKIRSGFASSYANLSQWLSAARADRKLKFDSEQKTARIFYGMVEGVLNWPALFSNGQSLGDADAMISELVNVFLSHYQS